MIFGGVLHDGAISRDVEKMKELLQIKIAHGHLEAGTLSGGFGSSDGYQTGFANLADTGVFCMSCETALAAVLEGTDFNAAFTDGSNGSQKQVDQANAFPAKGVAVLIVIPADSEDIVPAITA